jgi:hypothetical protein
MALLYGRFSAKNAGFRPRAENSYLLDLAGLTCVNSLPQRGNPAGVYASHRWAEASVPHLRQVMRQHVTYVLEEELISR